MKPAKILKVSSLVLFSALVILSVGALLFIKLYPAENILKLVTTGAEDALGRKVEVKGIGWSFGGITLEGVAIHESDEASPVLASVEKAGIRFSILSLLRSEFDIASITLKKPVCNISFNDKGEANIASLITGLSKKKGPGMSAKISKLTLSDATLTLSRPIPVLVPLAGTYVIDADVYLKEKIEVRDCTLKLPGDRGVLQPDLDIEILKDDFRITGKVHLENASLLWVYKWGDNVTLPYNIINGKVTNLIITKNYVKGNVKATSTLLGFPKLLHADGYCHVDIAGRTVFIGNAQGNVEKSSFYVEGLLFTFDGNLINFSVNRVAASVTDVMPMLKFMPRKLFGFAEGSLRYAGGLYNGTLAVSNAGYDPVQKVVSGLAATITVTNNTFQKTGIPFSFYGNPCTLSVASTERDLKRLYVNIVSDRISMDMLNEKLSGAKASVSVPMEILGAITVNQVLYGPYQMSNIQLQYLLSGSTFAIKGFQFYFAEGKISGSGTIGMAGEKPQASLALQIEKAHGPEGHRPERKVQEPFFRIGQRQGGYRFRAEQQHIPDRERQRGSDHRQGEAGRHGRPERPRPAPCRAQVQAQGPGVSTRSTGTSISGARIISSTRSFSIPTTSG